MIESREETKGKIGDLSPLSSKQEKGEFIGIFKA
jgi:hypothetical protein